MTRCEDRRYKSYTFL